MTITSPFGQDGRTFPSFTFGGRQGFDPFSFGAAPQFSPLMSLLSRQSGGQWGGFQQGPQARGGPEGGQQSHGGFDPFGRFGGLLDGVAGRAGQGSSSTDSQAPDTQPTRFGSTQGTAEALQGGGGGQSGSNYKSQYRQNMVNNASSIGSGFRFTTNGGELAGLSPGVTSQNWQEVPFGRTSIMTTKAAAKPSEAIREAFNNPRNFTMDCTSAVMMVTLKSDLDTIGDQAFDQKYADGLTVGNHEDAGVTPTTVRMANGQPQAGFSTVGRDLQVFDPSRGDRLVEGDVYYFENPGNDHDINRGWSVIYMGQKQDGTEQFWVPGSGIVDANLSEDGHFLINSGQLAGHYLGAYRAQPSSVA